MKLLFPEAEVTKSLSSNLLKRRHTYLQQDEKRVIAVNELMAKRIEELAVKMKQPENEGFVSGLQTETVDMLLQENADGEVGQSNVIKANAGENSEVLKAQAREEAAALLEEAKLQAEALKKEALIQAERESTQIRDLARAQGYEEGLAKAEAENSHLEEEWNQRSRKLEEEYQKKFDELEPEFVDTITGIYEHIFHVELRSYREVLAYLISTTMRKIEGNRNFMIHVSKEDYPYISMQKKQLAAGAAATSSAVEVVEDMTLGKNECLIETEGGIFDCGLGTELLELRQKLKMLSYEK